MSTSFNTNFDDSGDDIISAEHVKQFAAPVNALETEILLKQDADEKGVANGYASLDATGKVPSSQLPAPGATNLDALTDVAISSPASGQVLKHNGTQFVNATLAAGDLPSHTHAIADVTNLQTSLDAKQETSEKGAANGYAGLDATGKVPSSQLPATGATNLDDLTDVSITSPASGQVLRHNGTSFVNATLSPSDVGAAAASHSHPISDVTNLQTSLDAKQATSQKNAANGYAGLDAGSKLVASQMSEVMPLNGLSDVAISGPATGQTVRYNGTNFVNATLSPSDVGAASATHNHDAGDIVSGELGVVRGGTGASTAAGARINLDVPSNTDLSSGLAAKQDTSARNAANGYAGLDTGSKLASAQMSEVMPLNGLSDVAITSPETGQTVRYNGTSFVNAALSPGDVGAAPTTHTHDMADITSGSLGVARGGTGADLSATGGAGQVLKQDTMGGAVSVGTLSASEMPSGIDATKIGGGAVSNTEFGYLDGVTSKIQTQLNGKLPASGGTTGRIPYWSSGTTLTSSANLNFIGSGISTGSLTTTGSILSAGSISTSNGASINVSGQVYVGNMSNLSGGIPVYKRPNGQLVWLSSNSNHKKDVSTITATMDQIMNWRPIEFTWKQAFGEDRDLGFIAEELDSHYPLATIRDAEWRYTNSETGEYARDEHGAPLTTGNIVPMGVKYDRAWIPMLAAVQDFYRKFQEEQAKVSAFEERLAELESALGS